MLRFEYSVLRTHQRDSPQNELNSLESAFKIRMPHAGDRQGKHSREELNIEAVCRTSSLVSSPRPDASGVMRKAHLSDGKHALNGRTQQQNSLHDAITRL